MHYARWRIHGDPMIRKVGRRPAGMPIAPETRAKLSANKRAFYQTSRGREVAAQVGAAMRAEGHPQWKGDEATYTAYHHRVRAARGAPMECVECGETEGRLEWANLTGHYSDVNDYVAMCKSCHNRHDGIAQNLPCVKGVVGHG